MESFTAHVIAATDPLRIRAIGHKRLAARLDACAACSFRRGLECYKANEPSALSVRSVIPEKDCPLGLWPQPNKFTDLGVCLPLRSRKPRVAILLHDMAQGGIARYTASLVEALAGGNGSFDIVSVIFRRTYQFDAEAASDILRFCPVISTEDDIGQIGGTRACPRVKHEPGSQTYQQAIDEADVIITAGLHDFASLPDGVDFRGKPVVTQIHGIGDWSVKVIDYAKPFTTHYMGVSKVVQQEYQDRLGGDFTVIEPGVDMNRIAPVYGFRDARWKLLESADHALDLDLNTVVNESPWVVYYGRMSPEKRIPRMAAAVAELVDRARLKVLPVNERHLPRLYQSVGVFIGDGYDKAAQHGETRRLLPNRSILVPWSHVADVLAAADLFVCLSEAEGGPLTVVEALLAGVPVLSTPVGFVPSLTVEQPGGTYRQACIPVGHKESASSIADKLAFQLMQRKTGERILDDYLVAQATARRFNLHRFRDEWSSLLLRLVKQSPAQ